MANDEDGEDPLANDPVGKAYRSSRRETGQVGKTPGNRNPDTENKDASTGTDAPDKKITAGEAAARTLGGITGKPYRPIDPDDDTDGPAGYALEAKSGDKGGESTRRGREDARRKNSDRQEEFREQQRIDKKDESAGRNIDRHQNEQGKGWWRR